MSFDVADVTAFPERCMAFDTRNRKGASRRQTPTTQGVRMFFIVANFTLAGALLVLGF